LLLASLVLLSGFVLDLVLQEEEVAREEKSLAEERSRRKQVMTAFVHFVVFVLLLFILLPLLKAVLPFVRVCSWSRSATSWLGTCSRSSGRSTTSKLL
jgi:ABC-type Fe3+ transport system permease subunit